MSKNHTVQVSIGAALAGSFKSAFSDGSKQLTRLGDGMKKLETRAKGLGSFNKLQGDVRKAADRLAEAENKVHRLRLEMQKVDKPTKQMQTNFGRAQAAANKAKEALQKKRNELRRLKSELKLTSISSKKLALEQTKLGASADKLRSKYRLLNDSIARRQSILNKRSELRGQAFDMIALGAAIGSPIKAAIGFESAMADVKKVMSLPDDETAAQNVVGELEKKLKTLSREIPISAKGLAEIAAAGAQLGVGAESGKVTDVGVLGQFVETAAKMATAFGMTEEEAGNAMANLSNVLGIPIPEMKDLGDAINHLSDNTAAKARQIVKSMARVGGLAKNFGLQPVTIAALTDSFIALGKAPEEAGTAINRLLTRLATAEDQSPKFQAALAKMGMNASELKEAIANDAEGALVSFLETLSKVDDLDRTSIIFNMFGQQQVGSISALTGQLDVFKKALTAVQEKDGDKFKFAGSMEREFQSRRKTTEAQLNLLGNAFGELGINIGATLLPAIKEVVGGIGGAVRIMADIAQAFPLATKLIFGTIFAMIALRIGFIGLHFVSTFVTGGFALVKTALLKLRIQMLLSNVSFKAFNVTALVTSTRLKALAFAKVLAVAWGKLSVVIGLAKTKLLAFNATALITAGRMKILAFGSALKAFASGLISLATRAIPIVIGGLRALTVAMLTNPIGLLIGGIAIAAGFVIANWQKVKELFLNIWEPIKPAWEAFAAFVGKIWDAISAPFKAIGSVLGFLFGGDDVEANVSSNTVNSSLQPAFADVPNLSAGGAVASNVYNNSFNISVNAAEGQSVRQVADEVIRRIKAQSRGALFDQVPGVA